jgi:predicted metal-dependent hydrolase
MKYNIIVSPKRKTVAVTVYPNTRVVVRVPKKLPQEKIDDIVKSKEDWIMKKIQYFESNKYRLRK